MIDARPPRRQSAPVHHRLIPIILTVLLAVIVAAPASASSEPAPTATATVTTASTASTMASELLSWINRDRVAAGLRRVYPWPAMASLATQRAGRMAYYRTLSHTVAGGDPGVALTSRGLPWYSYGEIIGESGYAWGSAAAANLYAMWKASPYHHAIMFSSTFNYLGIGLALASNGTTYASILFTESPDHTRPVARNGSLTAIGTSIHFAWSGYDPLLQTHTAGLRGFNVLYRVDSGTWYRIRTLTTYRWLGLTNRAHRHYYSFRVQAVDWRGNLSAWTAVKRIWIP